MQKMNKTEKKRMMPYKNVAIPTVLQTVMLFSPTPPIDMEVKGKYACIVVDVNGLSSAYWWDGDKAPIKPNRCFVNVHVRDFTFAYYALGAILGLIIFVALLIFLLPDNKEDFEVEEDEDVVGAQPNPARDSKAQKKKAKKAEPTPAPAPSDASVHPEAAEEPEAVEQKKMN